MNEPQTIQLTPRIPTSRRDAHHSELETTAESEAGDRGDYGLGTVLNEIEEVIGGIHV